MGIGVDLDNVLGDTFERLIQWHNATYGTKLQIGDITVYDFAKVLGCSQEESRRRMKAFEESSYFTQILPINGAQPGIKLLNHAHNLMIVTARPVALEQQTVEWVTQHFPGRFSSIYYTGQYTTDGTKTTKAQICKSKGIDLLIEDSVEHALECHRVGIPVILLDYPWNQGDLPKGIERAYPWEDIVAKVLVK